MRSARKEDVSRPAARSPDQKRAQAAVLLAEGSSYREVERQTGISKSTVHRWRHEDGTFQDAIKASQVDVHDLCSALVHAAGSELLRRLRDSEALAAMDAATLNRICGTAADKLVALRRIESPSRFRRAEGAKVIEDSAVSGVNITGLSDAQAAALRDALGDVE